MFQLVSVQRTKPLVGCDGWFVSEEPSRIEAETTRRGDQTHKPTTPLLMILEHVKDRSAHM